MVNENLVVSNKICNGTNGTITEIKYCGLKKIREGNITMNICAKQMI